MPNFTGTAAGLTVTGQTTGAFRVIYVAKLDDAIYVRHCFQKKTKQTSRPDIDLAQKRYRDLKRELGK